MADRIETFQVTIPALTQISSPVTVATQFNDGNVDEIEIVIPSGPAGLMGFQIAYGDTCMIPRDNNSWIITDNEKIRWPLTDYPTGAHWTIKGYNLDGFDHSIYVRYLITETSQSQTGIGGTSIGVPATELTPSSTTSG